MMKAFTSTNWIFAVVVVLLAGLLALTACAISARGRWIPDPSKSFAEIGSTRSEVERQWGKPDCISSQEDGGKTAIYEYEIERKAPSPRAHTAILGVWMADGRPIDLVCEDRYIVQVTYDEDDKVIAVKK